LSFLIHGYVNDLLYTITDHISIPRLRYYKIYYYDKISGGMKKTRHKIFHSIADIKKSDWDNIFGQMIQGYSFFKTLEESKFKEFSFYYIVIYRGKYPIIITPAFISNINLETTAGSTFKKVVTAFRRIMPNFLITKVLFCGSPFRENGYIGIDKGIMGAEKVEALHALAGILERFAKKKKAQFVIFKDFLRSDTPALDSLISKGYSRITSLPSIIMDIDFDSIDGYLNSLSASRRKEFRRKLKKADKSDISVRVVDDVEDVIDDLYRLYINTYEKGRVKFEKLTREFFINIGRNLKPNVKFFLYFLDGKLAAFNLCLVYEDIFIDMYIGFDYDVSYKLNLYLVSWYRNVEWCLKHSISKYQVGQTDYIPKLALGGKPVDLFIYFKHRNPVKNMIFGIAAKMLRL